MHQIGLIKQAVENVDDHTRNLILDEALHLATNPEKALKMAVWRAALDTVPEEAQAHCLEVVAALGKRFQAKPDASEPVPPGKRLFLVR